MSSSLDPQTWVFPPLGAAVPPSDVSAAFGPISKGDKIKLEWAPASSTPEIAFICANDGTIFGVSDSNTSPFTYTFDQTINNGSSHTCWFFFPGTSLGNTLTFEYNNEGTGSSVLWEQDSQLAQALSGGSGASTIISTVTVTKTAKAPSGTGTTSGLIAAAAATTVTFTETITQTPSTLLTTIANPSTTFVSTSVQLLVQGTPAASTSAPNISTAQPSGLSAGAAAGITAAAIIAIALLLLLGWVLYSRRNRNRAQDSGMETAGMAAGVGPGVDRGPVVIPNTYKYQPPVQMQQQQQMQRQDQPLMQSYYNPASVSAPRRTIHEIGD